MIYSKELIFACTQSAYTLEINNMHWTMEKGSESYKLANFPFGFFPVSAGNNISTNRKRANAMNFKRSRIPVAFKCNIINWIESSVVCYM